jgi:hypothetical protein
VQYVESLGVRIIYPLEPGDLCFPSFIYFLQFFKQCIVMATSNNDDRQMTDGQHEVWAPDNLFAICLVLFMV